MLKKLLLIGLVMVLVIVACSGDDDEEADSGEDSRVVDVPDELNDSAQALADVLALIPDNAQTRDNMMIGYVDIHGVFTARPGAPLPADWQSYVALETADDELLRPLFGSGLASIQFGAWSFLQYFGEYERLPATAGFDVFQVQQSVEYGRPPSDVMLLAGDFDQAAIIAVHEAKGYTQETIGEAVLLCGPTGCEGIVDRALAERDTAYPFGGRFGRKQPVLLLPGAILSSADRAVIDTVLAVLDGSQQSLADDDSMQAMVEAIASSGSLVQAIIVEPSLTAYGDPVAGLIAGMGMQPSEENIASLMEAYGLDRPLSEQNLLPRYDLIAMAHVIDGSDEVALVLLVFDNEDDAQTAAERVVWRLNEFNSIQRGGNETYAEVLMPEDGPTMDAAFVVSGSSTGKSVMVLGFRQPLPPAEIEPEASRPRAIGITFARLTRMILNRDTFWLASLPELDSED